MRITKTSPPPLFIFYRRFNTNGETYRDMENQFSLADIKTDENMDAAEVTGQNPSFFF